MIFRQLKDEETSTYTYIVGDPVSHESVVIDPVREHVDYYLSLLQDQGLKLKYSLDTHVHADHVTGSGMLREKTGCQSAMGDLTRAECVNLRLKDGDVLKMGDFEIKTLHTPGHTPCHVAYLMKDRVFTGDALFINGCGRTDFQGGSPEQLWDSVIEKLFKLPPDSLVYPGHDYHEKKVSTIQQEIDHNERFQGRTKEAFIEFMNNLDLPDPKKMMEAVPANVGCGLK